MLVLSRKAGEKIRIGDDITIVVNRVMGSRVSVGIEAPPHVRIVRGELELFVDGGAGREASLPSVLSATSVEAPPAAVLPTPGSLNQAAPACPVPTAPDACCTRH